MCKTIDRWEKFLGMNNKESSVVGYVTDAKKFEKWLIETQGLTIDNNISEITNDHIEDFIYFMLDTNKKNTINRCIISLKKFFTYCHVNKKLIPTNIMDGVKVFTKGVNTKHKQVLSISELKQIIDMCDVRLKGDRNFEELSSRNKAIFSILTMGLRIQELLTLTMDDMDIFEDSYILTIKEENSKNGVSRKIPLTKKMGIYLDQYLVQRENLNKKNSDLIFLSARGEAITTSNMNVLINKLITACSIDRKISCHSFRASSKTLLSMTNMNHNLINILLGHQLSSIDASYIRIDSEMYISIKDSLEKLGF